MYKITILFFIATISNFTYSRDVILNFSGEIQSINCDVGAESQYQTIDLGDMKKEDLTTPGTRSPAVDFFININCVGNSRVRVLFTGQADSVNPQLLSLDDSSDKYRGVGVRLLTYNNSPLSINNDSNLFVVSFGNYAMQFKASLESTVNSHDIVVGPIKSTMMFTLNYF